MLVGAAYVKNVFVLQLLVWVLGRLNVASRADRVMIAKDLLIGYIARVACREDRRNDQNNFLICRNEMRSFKLNYIKSR